MERLTRDKADVRQCCQVDDCERTKCTSTEEGNNECSAQCAMHWLRNPKQPDPAALFLTRCDFEKTDRKLPVPSNADTTLRSSRRRNRKYRPRCTVCRTCWTPSFQWWNYANPSIWQCCLPASVRPICHWKETWSGRWPHCVHLLHYEPLWMRKEQHYSIAEIKIKFNKNK